MKILIDECLPRKLKYAFGDEPIVHTVSEAGWSGKKNGELLRLMNGVYDVFITIDGNLQYQQPIATVSIAFVVLSAKSNRLVDLLPLMPAVRHALATITVGQLIRIALD